MVSALNDEKSYEEVSERAAYWAHAARDLTHQEPGITREDIAYWAWEMIWECGGRDSGVFMLALTEHLRKVDMTPKLMHLFPLKTELVDDMHDFRKERMTETELISKFLRNLMGAELAEVGMLYRAWVHLNLFEQLKAQSEYQELKPVTSTTELKEIFNKALTKLSQTEAGAEYSVGVYSYTGLEIEYMPKEDHYKITLTAVKNGETVGELGAGMLSGRTNQVVLPKVMDWIKQMVHDSSYASPIVLK
jgi:hypothetical protein